MAESGLDLAVRRLGHSLVGAFHVHVHVRLAGWIPPGGRFLEGSELTSRDMRRRLSLIFRLEPLLKQQADCKHSDVGQPHQAGAGMGAGVIRQDERMALVRAAHVERLRLQRSVV
jgi:hypothetical protein